MQQTLKPQLLLTTNEHQAILAPKITTVLSVNKAAAAQHTKSCPLKKHNANLYAEEAGTNERQVHFSATLFNSIFRQQSNSYTAYQEPAIENHII